MSGIDPSEVLQQASHYDAPTFLFALFLIMCFLVVTTFWFTVVRPESKKRVDVMERHAAYGEANSAAQVKTAEAVQLLSKSASEAHDTARDRMLLTSSSITRAVKVGNHLCDALENLAGAIDKSERVSKPLTAMRNQLNEIEAEHDA